MEYNAHTIICRQGSDEKPYNWEEIHRIRIEKEIDSFFLFQIILSSTQKTEDFSIGNKFIIEYFLNFTSEETDKQFVSNLSNMETSWPILLLDHHVVKYCFPSLDDAMQFASDHLEEIKEIALKSVVTR